jgi:hypothetical protein
LMLSVAKPFKPSCPIADPYLLITWRYSSCRTLSASHTLWEISRQRIFTGCGRQPHA